MLLSCAKEEINGRIIKIVIINAFIGVLAELLPAFSLSKIKISVKCGLGDWPKQDILFCHLLCKARVIIPDFICPDKCPPRITF